MPARPIVIVVVAAATLVVIFAGLWRFAPREATLEYSGSCGAFRWCHSRLWGARRTCVLAQTDIGSEPPLRRFAPDEACAADWILLYRDVHQLFIAGRGAGSPHGPIVNKLRHFHSLSNDAFRQRMSRDPTMRDFLETEPYRLGACGGYRTQLAVDRYVIALVGQRDGALHCWVLTSAGELRHLMGEDAVVTSSLLDASAVELREGDSQQLCLELRALRASRMPVDGGEPEEHPPDSGCTDAVSSEDAVKLRLCSSVYGTPAAVSALRYDVAPELQPAVYRCVKNARLDGGVMSFEASRVPYGPNGPQRAPPSLPTP